MSEIHYVTEEGLEKLKAELQDMRTRGRQEIARQIKEAREKGDLSENAEYDAAKEAQGLLELKISKLEAVIGNSRILDKSKLDTSRVTVMTTVRLKNAKTGKEVSYQLVSEKEADLKAGKISVTSPIGKGLLGKQVGETAEIQVPAGVMAFEVLEISA
jgi:transcription elongation factor GreA